MGNARREFEREERGTRTHRQPAERQPVLRTESREEYRKLSTSRNTVPRTPSVRTAGVIKTLVPQKGFGFIVEDGTRVEVFFHRSQAADFDVMDEGERVTMEVQESPKGLRAQRVEYEA